MSFIKRIVTIVALVYLLLALLMLFFPSATGSIFGLTTLPLEVNLLMGLTWGSVVVVGLLLIFENIDSGLLRRTIDQQEKKINELKAQLFDAKKPLAAPTTAPGLHTPPPYPTAYDAPVTPTPPTY